MFLTFIAADEQNIQGKASDGSATPATSDNGAVFRAHTLLGPGDDTVFGRFHVNNMTR